MREHSLRRSVRKCDVQAIPLAVIKNRLRKNRLKKRMHCTHTGTSTDGMRWCHRVAMGWWCSSVLLSGLLVLWSIRTSILLLFVTCQLKYTGNELHIRLFLAQQENINNITVLHPSDWININYILIRLWKVTNCYTLLGLLAFLEKYIGCIPVNFDQTDWNPNESSIIIIIWFGAGLWLF